MLKKSLFSPAQPRARRDAPFSHAAFSHRSGPQRGPGRLTDSAARTDVVLLIRRIVRLAAALLDGYFEHSGGMFDPDLLAINSLWCRSDFSAPC
jgi:hypothetical protein